MDFTFGSKGTQSSAEADFKTFCGVIPPMNRWAIFIQSAKADDRKNTFEAKP